MDRRMARPPNILFLWTDEQRADTLSAYGNRFGVTPCLDRFAAEATVFEQAYCTAPVCTPSRGSVMTGQFPLHHGAVTNNVPLHADARCLPALLPEHEAAYIGKWHLGDEIFSQHGFSTWVSTEDMYLPHYGPGRDRAQRSDYHHWLIARGRQPDPRNNVFGRAIVTALPEHLSKPRFQADRAVEFLRARADAKQPWLLSVNTLEPHMPFTGPRDNQYDPRDLPLSPNALIPPDASCLLRTRIKHALQTRKGQAGCHPNDEGSVRETMARYWGLASQVDHYFGRILNALRESGQWDDTLIVFTSDHGDQMGSHALIAKGVFFEESTRVPLLIKTVGQRAGRRVAGPVSQVDLAATLCDLAGAPAPTTDGASLCPALECGVAPERDVLLVWHRHGGEDNGERISTGDDYLASLGTPEQCDRALRGELRGLVAPDRWKVLFSDAGECELYDLNDDPWELRNRANDPAARARRNDLALRLRRKLAALGDPFPLPKT